MKRLTRILFLAALAACLGATAQAQDPSTNGAATPPSTNAPAAAPKRPRAKPITGVVDSVDTAAMSFLLKGHDKPIYITSDTRIVKDGQPAVSSDIVAGETVSVRAKESDGKLMASRIRIGPPKPRNPESAPPAPAAPAAPQSNPNQ